MISLSPCDILVSDRVPSTVFEKAEALWLGNRNTHVRMYYGSVSKTRVFYEAAGRGVLLTEFADCTDTVIAVRPIITNAQSKRVRATAFEIATDTNSWYDFEGLLTSVPMAAMLRRFGIARPYNRNGKYLCTEAVAECFWRNQIDIGVPQDRWPLPADFLYAGQRLGRGVVGVDIVAD